MLLCRVTNTALLHMTPLLEYLLKQLGLSAQGYNRSAPPVHETCSLRVKLGVQPTCCGKKLWLVCIN